MEELAANVREADEQATQGQAQAETVQALTGEYALSMAEVSAAMRSSLGSSDATGAAADLIE